MFDTQLNTAEYISLSTQKRDGSTVETPVWFAQDGDKIYVFTEGNAGKVKRLRNFPQCRIAVCTVRGKLKGNWIATRGKIIEDDQERRMAYKALRRKYDWKLTTLDFFSRLGGKIDKRAFMVITEQ
ncbi:MAG TPA: PPOX class F420-dependent oxidoreductase [Gammaproteobacteria bacterium]|nr:PPOX class F420-dependent oxidoreductase [Gammaproteobacteria bacterium]